MAETHYRDLAEAEQIVASFEDRSLPPESWSHSAHLTVALWYLLRHDEAGATAEMISRIRSYNHAHRIRRTTTGGYHETLTLFWMAIARRFLDASRGGAPLDLLNRFLDAYGRRKRLHEQYYSRERFRSPRAREVWVEPDLRKIDE